MRIIHLGRNGQDLGSFPEDQIPAKVQSGELLPTDLAWTDGMAQWQPLGSVVPLNPMPAMPQPQMQVGPAQPLNYVSVADDLRPLPWKKPRQYLIGWLTCYVITLILELFFYDQANLARTEMWVDLVYLVASLLSLIFGILSLVYGAILHYRCWKMVPGQFRRTSPGLAIGLMFIPLFNVFWIVPSYVGMAKSIKAWTESLGRTFSRKVLTLASSVALIFILSFVVGVATTIANVFENADAMRTGSQQPDNLTTLVLQGVMIIAQIIVMLYFYGEVVRQSHDNLGIGASA